jgi:pyruvate kinase
MKKKIIITIGPATLSKKNLKRLKKTSVSLFRINLSHTNKTQLIDYIKKLKENNLNPICIDTEGAQVRTVGVKKILVQKNKIVSLGHDLFLSKKNINLYPKFNMDCITVGSKVLIGFDNLSMIVTKKYSNYVKAKVLTSGVLEANKGVHFQDKIELSPLTEKDIECIKIAKKFKINHFALSFANSELGIRMIKKIITKNDILISKIETKMGFENRKSIIKKSDIILIDRGDLSRYIPISKIPIAQKIIVKDCIKNKKPVYIATNLLESMLTQVVPTRAESNDIYNSLIDGADGLVLAAETAIGKNPFETINFLQSCINSYYQSIKKNWKMRNLFK